MLSMTFCSLISYLINSLIVLDDIDSPSKKKIKEKTERKKKKKFEDEEEKKSLSSASAHKEKKTKKKKPDCDKMGPTDLYVKKHGNKKLKAGHMKPVTDALIVVDNTSDMPVPELEILGDSTDCTITKRCKKNIEYGYFDEDSEDIDNQDAMEDSFDDSTQDPDYSTESSDESIAHSDNVEAGYVSDSSSNMSDTVPLVDTLPVLSNTKCCSEINLSQTEKKPAISIQTSSNTKVQRVWDKVHYCFFCEISSTNISKHYLGPHQSEAEVQKILSYPKKSEARRLELLKLRNAGDYKHNTDILKKGEGVLVTWTRRPEDEVSSGDFLPCEDCLAFFLRSNLWRHRKVCPFRKEGAKYRKVQSEASFLLPSSHEVNKGLEMNVLRKMNADEITIAARNDRIITKVGEKLYQKHGHLPHLYSHVSQKMRELARLLIAVRGQQPDVNSLSDLLHPERFMLAVKATKILCNFSEDTNTYGNPSLALKIGHLLKKCAKIKKSSALSSGDSDLGKNADDFLTLLDDEWTDEISSSALQTLNTNKMNKGQLLPLTEDLKKLQCYFQEKSKSLSASLQNSFSKPDWELLNQLTLARLVMFNRRRGGETQRITLEGYAAKLTKHDSLQEIKDSLSPVEKMLCETFGRVEIRGKKGRTVPVLLTPAIQQSIDLLLKWRKEAQIPDENPYLFARPNYDSLQPIRSSDVLRRFAHEPELELSSPENITSTQLRKHVATVSQVPVAVAQASTSGQKGKRRSIHHLTEEQTNTLRRLFKTNVAFRRDLKKHECLQAIKKNRCLNELDWKKVKNTVHSWIILEKKKTIKLATAKC
ncbi:uncharacterized protein LOC117319420 [Pecten maximus]|uniref:uncharacterized protein LOC117319420 n=1 Tax=Pecten maximus TaxID=6579 RepID=UPI001457FAC6|nr:uncharacterized protein LOC117319420 [Pecten maximus]